MNLDNLDEEIERTRQERERGISLKDVTMDSDFYGDNKHDYDTSIAVDPQDIEREENESLSTKLPDYTGPKHLRDDIPIDEDHDPFKDTRRKTIVEREDDYHKRRLKRMQISPDRVDQYSDKTPSKEQRTYSDILTESKLEKEESKVLRQIAAKEEKKLEREKELRKERDAEKEEKNKEREKEIRSKKRDKRDKKRDKDRDDKKRRKDDRDDKKRDRSKDRDEKKRSRDDKKRDRSRDRDDKKRRKDDRDDKDRDDGERKRDRDDKRDKDERDREEKKRRKNDDDEKKDKKKSEEIDEDKKRNAKIDESEDDSESSSHSVSRWDKIPNKSTPSKWDSTPTKAGSGSRWDVTPTLTSRTKGSRWDETPSDKRSRWDETPSNLKDPAITPLGGTGLMTPNPGSIPMTSEQLFARRWERDIAMRNKPLTDEELDELLPSDGYSICKPPPDYKPIYTPARKLQQTPLFEEEEFLIGEENVIDPSAYGVIPDLHDMPEVKPEDKLFFEKLFDGKDDSQLSAEEVKERKIMKLLLKVKNGTPPQRKQALRQITDNARDFGPASLFSHILPLLMSPTLEDQERHLLVKVIDRILYKLDDLVRPYVHKILVVIEPLLIDEDYYARVEGREIISNLAKAAGLATMIAVMRPDIDNEDEYVRNTTARAFAVVASALGIPSLIPFLKAVCQSKSSWQARHTGIKIVQQIAILMGYAVLPHLKSLVMIIENGLKDTEHKVRTITALALAALAEASTPYGIESFDTVLRPLWMGIREHRGKGLAAFLKAIGYIIPLMDKDYASFYTSEVMMVLIREFASPDEEMKKIVLKVVKQCVSTDGVSATYVKEEIMVPFFKHFWVRRMALDKRNYKQLVDTTVELAKKVGVSEIITRIVDDLRDESEPYRKMVCETIDRIITEQGVSDISNRLEEQLMDGILYSFQEQVSDDTQTVINSFGTIVSALSVRCKGYLPQIAGVIKWRLTNKMPKVRQQAADLVSRIAPVMMTCEEEKLLGHLGVFLYEYLGEEYPEVLGSILGALKAIVNVIGMNKMTPPIKELLPRLTPILKNRHEKVQENCIDLVGRIADRGSEYVSAREWMRICFELLEMLKAHKKGIRRAAVNTFGYIAKAIGPQDVLCTLLNNLRVQERQNRVCTTVAIAIVAETCAPFTVLPALMNEYRVPELNVQNGVLKALSFLFEYIGEMGRDYIYAVTPLLVDALMDRDLVHRQTAMTVVKHMALGVFGLGAEDALIHLLNYVWPNVLETSPHVHNAFMEAIEGLRVSLGPGILFAYVLQGLFHAARKVRTVYWKVYNNLYIGSYNSMISSYPRYPEQESTTTTTGIKRNYQVPDHNYTVAELNMFI